MCSRGIQVCTRSFPCHFIHPLNRPLLGACSGWFVLGAKDKKALKQDPSLEKFTLAGKTLLELQHYNFPQLTEAEG